MKILRVNMSNLTIATENVPEKYYLLGGRALTSRIIYDEVEATCHPLGENNKLAIAPGLLAGTPAPSSGRLSVGTKSPLTGTIKESNAGGIAAQKLARIGVKAVVIEGKADGWYILKLTGNGGELIPAGDLVGKGNYDAGDILRAEFGEKTAVMTIGQAGEARMTAASIAVADMEGRPVRHCGRGGTGAVMGSKGLKAIVIDDTGAEGVEIKDKEKFKEAAQAFSKMLLANPTCGQGLPTYGTAVLVNILNESGALPTRNFQEGRFIGAEKISGEFMYDTIVKRGGKPTHACHPGCVMRCSQVYNDADGNYLTAGFEYETIWAFGADCEVDDLDQIAMLDRLCDDIGVDTIEMGVTFGVAMEGGLLPFGDGEGMIRIMKEEVAKATPLGRILGQGAAVTGQVFGVTRVPVVKKQSIPAYDPRAVKGVAVTYATTPMGADHTAGYSVATNILKVGGFVDPLKKEGQVELSRNLQIATSVLDSMGLCLFVAFTVLDEAKAFPAIVDMLTAQYGVEFDVTETLGVNNLKVERAYNKRAGFTAADDRLPEFFYKEPINTHNVLFDITNEELDSTMAPFDMEEEVAEAAATKE